MVGLKIEGKRNKKVTEWKKVLKLVNGFEKRNKVIITFEIDFKCDDGVYDNIDEILNV